jgi:hypothetical protein
MSAHAKKHQLVKSGWLYKKGAVRRNWKKRWFELTETHLRYYTAPHGTKGCEEKGLIVLQGRPPPHLNDSQHVNGFEIPGVGNGKEIKEDGHTSLLRAFYLYAETEEERQDWVEKLVFWSRGAATRKAITQAQECHVILQQRLEEKNWNTDVLAEVEPGIASNGSVSLKGSITACPLKDALMSNADSMKLRQLASNRLHLVVGLATPLPAPWAGKLVLCPGLEQYLDDLDEKIVVCLDDLFEFILESEGDSMRKRNAQQMFPLLFEAITSIIFPLSPEATDTREGYIELGEKMEMELEKYEDLSWAKLEIAYSLLEKLISWAPCEERTYVTQHLVQTLINQFRSLDPRERDAVHACLLKIFLVDKAMRAHMVACMNTFLLEATFQIFRKVGIASILALLTDCLCEVYEDSIMDDMLLSLCPALLALHRPSFVLEYHEQLMSLLFHYVVMDPRHDHEDSFRVKTIRMLLKHWPRSDTNKEEAFLGELEGLLAEMPQIQQSVIGIEVIGGILKVLEGQCFCNIHRSLEMLQLQEVQTLLEQESMMPSAKKKITNIAYKFIEYEHWDDLAIGQVALDTLQFYAHVEDEVEEQQYDIPAPELPAIPPPMQNRTERAVSRARGLSRQSDDGGYRASRGSSAQMQHVSMGSDSAVADAVGAGALARNRGNSNSGSSRVRTKSAEAGVMLHDDVPEHVRQVR